MILDSGVSCSILSGSVVLHCPLLGLSRSARTTGDLDVQKFVMLSEFLYFSPELLDK